MENTTFTWQNTDPLELSLEFRALSHLKYFSWENLLLWPQKINIPHVKQPIVVNYVI